MASHEENTISPIDDTIYAPTTEPEEAPEMQEYHFDPEREVWGSHEDVNQYNPGGFHPVHIGDVINDRFEIIHKLGQGGFGMVWLCHDNLKRSWRALKILAASQTESSKERSVIQHLMKYHMPDKLKENHLLMPLEMFTIEGPNGKHVCQVLRVMGYSVGQWRDELEDEDEDKSGAKMRDMCYQIAQGAALLHSVGVVHGDLRPGNILMEIDQKAINSLSKAALLELIDEPPSIIPIYTKDGEDCGAHAPRYTVAPIYGQWYSKFLLPQVAIGDFGESFRITDPEKTTGIPLDYAAPEIVLPGRAGLGSDIWSLACTLYEVRTGKALLGSDEAGGARVGALVHEFEALLGPLPEPFRARWDEADYIKPDVLDAPRKDADLLALDDQPGVVRPVTCTPSQLGLARKILVSGTPYDDVFCGLLGKKRGDYETHFYDEEELEDMRESGVDMEAFFEQARREAAEQGYKYAEEEILALGDLLGQMVKYESEGRLAASMVLQHPWFDDVAAKDAAVSAPAPVPKPVKQVQEESGEEDAEKPLLRREQQDLPESLPLPSSRGSALVGSLIVILFLLACIAAYGFVKPESGVANAVWKGLKGWQSVSCTCRKITQDL